MDPRSATAPEGKKWVVNAATSSKRQLRLRVGGEQSPSNSRLASPALEAGRRPHTSPAPLLTPQFHWNLNATALRSLDTEQLERLYGLFRFYDSSTTGDTLPAINCARLLEILRDAQLLADDASISKTSPGNSLSAARLGIASVERIFAQAAMGKMRVYLDADALPALPFPVFCGSLMNCAMLLFPEMPPEAALQEILPALFQAPVLSERPPVSTRRGLLSHLPTEGSIALWVPGETQGLPELPRDAVGPDYRGLPPFQQVIADCTLDKRLEQRQQERLARQYLVPGELASSFHPDTLALVSSKFRLFDVFDRGALPRHEVFSLLGSMDKRMGLPDPYSILALLAPPGNASATATAPSATPSVIFTASPGSSEPGEVTLVQLLHAIEASRTAARQSQASKLALNRGILSRQSSLRRPDASAATSTEGGSTPLGKSTQLLTASAEENDDEDNDDHPVDSRGGSSASGGSSSSGSRAKERGKKAGGKTRVSMASQASTAGASLGTSSHTLLGNSGRHQGGPRTQLNHNASISGKKKSELHRKTSIAPSAKAESPAAADSGAHNRLGRLRLGGDHVSTTQVRTGPEPRSQRSATTVSSRSDEDRTVLGPGNALLPRPDELASANNRQKRLREADEERDTAASASGEPPGGRRALRVFLLLGGDHDGAICCALSLYWTTCEIVESEGVYYSTAPSEPTTTTPVLPTQKNLRNALLMLKKRVLARQERGFELCPGNQLDRIDRLLHQLEQRQPHFSLALNSAPKAAPKTAPTTATSGVNTPEASVNADGPESSLRLHRAAAPAQPAAPSSPPNSAQDRPAYSRGSTAASFVSRDSARGSLTAAPVEIIPSTAPQSPTQLRQHELPSNYKDLLSAWEVSQDDNYAWIHDVNAASPLKPASPLRPVSPTHSSPPRSPNNWYQQSMAFPTTPAAPDAGTILTADTVTARAAAAKTNRSSSHHLRPLRLPTAGETHLELQSSQESTRNTHQDL